MYFFIYIIFIYFFSNILTIFLHNIIPNKIELGLNKTFELNVSNLTIIDVEFKFELKDKFNNKIFELECFNKSSVLLECNEIQILIYEHTQILSNPDLNLFFNNEKTNLTLTIEKPNSLELIKNYNNNFNIFNYAIAKFELVVNYNKLYNSSFTFKIGDENIYDCVINDDNVNLLVCEHEIITNKNILTLKLNDNNEISYNIKEYSKQFSKILNVLKSTYFINQNEQNVYFKVDSSYKMNESEIYLKNSKNEKILLSNCSFFNYGFDYAKCNAMLKNIDNYDVYVNNLNTNIKISVLDLPKIISNIEKINPNKILISGEETKFILNVDYVVNLNNTILTLENEFFSDEEKIFLNCVEIEENFNQIECSCKFSNSGVYYVYLNGIKQKVKIVVYNNNLTKALKIEPEIIKIESSKIENITIIFDSIENIYNSKFYLKSDDNITLNLTLNYRCCNLYAFFDVMIFIEKTYFLYINDTKQNFITISATKNNFTSKIIEISPKSIATFFKGFFTLKVDNNTGISSVTIILKKDDDDNKIDLKCKEDLLNWEFAQCEFDGDFIEGSYKIYLNETEQENLIVNSIFMPELMYFFPMRIFPSLNKQNVSLIFSDDVENFTNKINFVSDEFNLSSNCIENDDFFINCSAEFKNEGEYFIYVDDVNYGKFIFVNKEENFVEINENFSIFVKNCFLFLILMLIIF